MRNGLRGALLALLLVFAGAAAAEQLALLVGVTQYPNLGAAQQLKAPVNDVQLMRQVLQQWGFDARRIEVLADGVPGAALPTQAAIVDALERLARRARSGDTVVLYFAGHGSLQKVSAGASAGSGEGAHWQPVFLPRDVRHWDGGQDARIPNAIPDTTLRQLVDRINDTGAFVWAVFDACHSAKLVRGALPGRDGRQLRVRQLEPSSLGLTGEAPSEVWPSWVAPAAATPTAPRTGARERGQAVYFYAAQSFEQAASEALPTGGATQWHGLFSWTIAQALARGQPMSYGQLGNHVLAQYDRLPVAAATPLYSGDGLASAVFGRQAPLVRQWALERRGGTLWLQAGSLSGLGEGALLALLTDPLAAPAGAATQAPPGTLGFVRITSVEANRSVLQPVAWQGWAALSAQNLPAGSWARLVSSPNAFSLRVAVERGGCNDHCAASRAVARLQRDGVPGVDVRWNAPVEGAEVRLQLSDGGIRLLLPGDADDLSTFWRLPTAASAHARSAPAEDPVPLEIASQQMADALHGIARTRNLLRLAAEMALRAPTANLVLNLSMRQGGVNGPDRPLASGNLAAISKGDVVVARARNTGGDPVDVAMFWLGADNSIRQVFPREAGDSPRLSATEKPVPVGVSIGDRSVGTERLLVLSMPMRAGREATDFRFLEQGPLTRTRGANDPDMQALFDACFADYALRGEATPTLPADRLGLQIHTFQVRR